MSKKKQIKKTNALRHLDDAGISYEVTSFDVPEEHIDAVKMSELNHLPVEQVFKTIVLEAERGDYLVACIPSYASINLKKVASLSGHKKLELLALKDLTKVTGYVRGGCSPIGMKKLFKTYVDESALNYDKIYVSAGKRGMQVSLAPQDLLTICQASSAALCQ
ncbi:Cys-tRNA(Pro) deacylase [Atopobacter sp. AH10]|uniref:Cys-tRNA(Pro) deacylase n=1 Tax=Atopobacter sp. AH10 TaxID=2315861 RepID=UPI000EF2763E|nr:Cys-tRNA(Pro) deacylase [Atopobacter sp. AH10]RLK63722.1 Cys-tRNA(Pro) deacylase [Atopobacter sp. AH10]